ncbi:MAG: lytic transglycosylase domain-containing protein [Bacteroidales bacterium]|nr:lytic transglycosylase domain-containing protein [Bacteroidales bacterium]
MKFSPYILHTLVAGVTALAIVGTVRAAGNDSGDDVVVESAFAEVVNPPVPSSVTLCGQRVDLDRVDNYERLDRELTSLAYTHGNTLLVLKRANRYFPQIAPILRDNGMPDDLLYLAVTESMLNPRAVSGAKAGGIWQFMPATAKEYGLEISDEVDERFNIEKATAAACRYFKRALSLYGGNWMSVMAAYNGGMARITRQLDAQMAKDALDLYLNEETSRYPFRVMAYKTIMENPADYGFRLTAGQLYQPRVVDVVEVSGAVDDWAVWARQHGISYATLRDENPWIRAPKLTNKSGKTYRVRVPRKESLSRSKSTKSVYNKNWVTK